LYTLAERFLDLFIALLASLAYKEWSEGLIDFVTTAKPKVVESYQNFIVSLNKILIEKETSKLIRSVKASKDASSQQNRKDKDNSIEEQKNELLKVERQSSSKQQTRKKVTLDFKGLNMTTGTFLEAS